MVGALQIILRMGLALGLAFLTYLIARSHQPLGYDAGELAAVGLALLGLTIWSWRQPPPAHGLAERAGLLIRHGVSIAGLLLALVICAGALVIGGLTAH